MKTRLLVAVVTIALCTYVPLVAGDLDNKIDQLAQEISSRAEAGGKTKIAVIEFSDLRGNVTDFGMFLAEELITKLFSSVRFEVIERQLLNKIMQEHKLSLTGTVDPASAKELGKILGVDAIVSGTVTDLGKRLKINARLISTESGNVFSAAGVTIEKDEEVRQLLRQVIAPQEQATQYQEAPQRQDIEPTTSGYLYLEDFTKVQQGKIPPGWKGGEAMVVKRGKGGKLELTNFEVRSDLYIQTCKIASPPNLDLEIAFWWDYGHFIIRLGNLVINLRDSGEIQIRSTSLNVRRRLENDLHTLSVQKRGDVFSFYLDHKEIHVARYRDVVIDSIAFTNQHPRWPTRHFGIQKIAARYPD